MKVESTPAEVEMYWSEAVEEGRRELEIVYTFTQQFPEGLFERLSTQLQGEAVIRIDWANTIYIETADSQILVKRYINVKTLDINVSIQVRNQYHTMNDISTDNGNHDAITHATVTQYYRELCPLICCTVTTLEYTYTYIQWYTFD